MILAMLFVLQVARGDEPPAAPPLAFTAIPRCPRDTGSDEVVVCGKVDQNVYRLRPLPPRYDGKDGHLPSAELPLAGGTIGVTTQSGNVGGVATNRVMLGWKVRF